MKSLLQCVSAVLAFAFLYAGMAHADSYDDAISAFKSAGKSGAFFDKSYGYAVFPTIGGAGFLIGDTSMSLLSAGFQAGAKAYSEIIFFEDKRALDAFESGNFEFGADASAVAVTAGGEAGGGPPAAHAEASADSSNANTKGGYHNGMAVFTIAKGGLMYAATISGQKFSFTPRGGS